MASVAFTPTSAVKLLPLICKEMDKFVIPVDVLYNHLADVGKPILAFPQDDD